MNENNVSYEIILNRMLERVPATFDKRVGSIIYDALAPAAAEFMLMRIELQSISNSAHIDTSVGEDLDRVAPQYGSSRKSATYATRKAIFADSDGAAMDITIGTRFSCGDLNFAVQEKITTGEYAVICETRGEAGNIPQGMMIPIDYIDGLGSATMTDILIPGVDEEDDEELRARCQSRFTAPVQNANIMQYLQWADGFEGIGVARVFSLWNGGNTVKVVITDRNNQPATNTLVDSFQEYLDPGSKGLGNGVAPIGAKVTVTSGISKTINVSGTILLNNGYTAPDGVEKCIEEYLSSIVFQKTSVSYMRVGSAILDASSIADLQDLKINNGTADIALQPEEIPVLGALNLVVGTQ